jgi:trypsin-like peptidase
LLSASAHDKILFVELTETAAIVQRSLVALGSLAVPAKYRFGPNEGIPQIIGTGFVVDARGIVMTAGHVARALQSLPRHPGTGKHAALAILFEEPRRVGDALEVKPLWIEVKAYSFLENFTTNEGIFYGEELPDLAFVQLGVRDVPALTFCTEAGAIRLGVDVAYAGFPFGSDGLLLAIEDRPPVVVQGTPFLRHGIISSVHPFPCLQPHGFSIDAISQGGASGSPIFRRDDPSVVGMLYAAFEGAGLTYALPGHLLQWAARTALSDGTINLDRLPSLSEYRSGGNRLDAWHVPERP